MYKFILILTGCFILCSSSRFTFSDEKLDWMKLEDVSSKIKEQNKPVLIDLYTDWCGWCKVMDKKTYSKQKVIDYINEHFYAAKVNAETKDPISWRNKTYSFNSTYRLNDFALYVTNGQAGFPTTVIIA